MDMLQYLSLLLYCLYMVACNCCYSTYIYILAVSYYIAISKRSWPYKGRDRDKRFLYEVLA